jgi:hypothetical protein
MTSLFKKSTRKGSDAARGRLWRWHRTLMASADLDDAVRGAWRDRLGWVRGPTPHRAAHVATPADQIDRLMIDLVEYASAQSRDRSTPWSAPRRLPR